MDVVVAKRVYLFPIFIALANETNIFLQLLQHNLRYFPSILALWEQKYSKTVLENGKGAMQRS